MSDIINTEIKKYVRENMERSMWRVSESMLCDGVIHYKREVNDATATLTFDELRKTAAKFKDELRALEPNLPREIIPSLSKSFNIWSMPIAYRPASMVMSTGLVFPSLAELAADARRRFAQACDRLEAVEARLERWNRGE